MGKRYTAWETWGQSSRRAQINQRNTSGIISRSLIGRVAAPPGCPAPGEGGKGLLNEEGQTGTLSYRSPSTVSRLLKTWTTRCPPQTTPISTQASRRRTTQPSPRKQLQQQQWQQHLPTCQPTSPPTPTRRPPTTPPTTSCPASPQRPWFPRDPTPPPRRPPRAPPTPPWPQ